MKRDERMFEKPISINYLKLQPYFGSYNGTSFALIKKEDKLEAYLYPGPFGFDATPDEKKLKQEFEFSDTGYAEAVAWMDEHYKDYDRKLIAEDCKQRFSEEVIAKKIENLFKDVIAKTNR